MCHNIHGIVVCNFSHNIENDLFYHSKDHHNNNNLLFK